MGLIQSALCCLYPGAPSKHLQHSSQTHRKFFTDTWSPETWIFKKESQKPKISNLKILCEIVDFSKAEFFEGRFFSTCRMDLIQSALCCPYPGASSKHLQHSSQTHRKLFTDTWSPEAWIFEKESQKAKILQLKLGVQKLNEWLVKKIQGKNSQNSSKTRNNLTEWY